MSRFPRTLVVTSCSDLKTQPKVSVDTRLLQKQAREKYRQIRKREVELDADPRQCAADSQLQSLWAQLSEIRGELRKYMLLEEDFRDRATLPGREEELASYRCRAAEMYAGPHHEDVMKGINALRDRFGPECVDVKIISAGYGLIDEDALIAPYDLTFTGMEGEQLDEWATALGIHDALQHAVQPYDLVIFLLGKEYLRALHLPISFNRGSQRLLFVLSQSCLPFLNYDPDYGVAMVGNKEVHDFRAAAVSLKGKVFRLFSEVVAKTGWHRMELVQHSPEMFLHSIDGLRASHLPEAVQVRSTQLSWFDQVPAAANTNFPMTYFMPENEDRVDPGFEPWTLSSKTRRNGGNHHTDHYAHEILGKAPYDGILISLHEISQWSQDRQEEIYNKGARTYLRYYDGPILGDCGAFTFDDQGDPPFTAAEVLERYRRLRIDMGVSVDYLIFPDLWQKDPQEAARRFERNLAGARRFWEAWQTVRVQFPTWNFTPIGVAQGGTPEKFREAVQELQEIGYRYIALGGLARSPASFIEPCLAAVAPVLRPDTQVHLFGFAKLDLSPRFRELGITSFDSTSPLLQGLMRGVYWDPTDLGKQYPAIRVPFSGGRTAAKKARSGHQEVEVEESLRLERDVLAALRAYGVEPTEGNCITARDSLVKYDQYLQPWPYNPHIWGSIETLKARPWEKCTCKICRDWGIAVALIRSNNHNRRRGFHNTWVFFNKKTERVGPGMSVNV